MPSHSREQVCTRHGSALGARDGGREVMVVVVVVTVVVMVGNAIVKFCHLGKKCCFVKPRRSMDCHEFADVCVCTIFV